ncbi:hypothetical protein SODALDRAFT_334478 [Sodiomyces alkalinus F11]|uniref:Uncharacterized protein n=1 Tax=Sodiomyces alkalinus (strain CBS 110278 / VKM F-3762 / F11) TaxID=1314773 RepID=A0A3N2PSC2_SODAK|nr:hypothetical protein SODALDRAFT_334478 [Sodiomyces alkalinus F11]ROT37388.1 hypothetical protein SODALDRAFT_334478 [Sodiomyces alkalinus F11]
MDTFVPVDPPRCAHYAKFASHLWRWQFDLIYWTLFGFNLFILFSAAYAYTKCLEKLDSYPRDCPQRKRTTVRCIIFASGCVVLSLTTVIMEVFALLALQFCDGEDLMSLYWSTWTMMQVGSLIAVCGIILALLHNLRDRKHPPWALALGTPVLVAAGLFSFLQSCASKRLKQFDEWKRIAKKQRQRGRDGVLEEGTVPMSQVNTIAVDRDDDDKDDDDKDDNGAQEGGALRAEIIGLTLDGGPIIHFNEALPSRLPNHARIIGRCDGGKPIVICKKDGFQFVYRTGGAASHSNDKPG